MCTFLMEINMNKEFIKLAIKEAKKAYKINEIPVGCVIAKENNILSSSHNTREKDNKITSHAEIKAIVSASKKISDWRLNDCVLYTTLFPCPMCASAIQQSRISKIYYILDTNNETNSRISRKILKTNKKCSINKIDIEFDLLDRFFEKIR